MNKKNIEVEIRSLVPDLKLFEEKLKSTGAKFMKNSYLLDLYLCEKSATKVEDVEMDEVGSYSMRLRKSRKDGKETVTINTKVIKNHGDHNAWEEHESEVEDFEEVAKILTLTEFKPFFRLEKDRRIYEYEGMEISVEDIVDFSGAVEVELMVSEGEESKAKEKIIKFLESLEITKEDIVPKSVTNIIMKERAFKQDISL